MKPMLTWVFWMQGQSKWSECVNCSTSCTDHSVFPLLSVAKKILGMMEHQVDLGQDCRITVVAKPVQLMMPSVVEVHQWDRLSQIWISPPWVWLESVLASCEWSVPVRPADIFWGVSSAHIDLQPAQDGRGAPGGPAGDPLLQEQKQRRRSGFMWYYDRLLDGGPQICEWKQWASSVLYI